MTPKTLVRALPSTDIQPSHLSDRMAQERELLSLWAGPRMFNVWALLARLWGSHPSASTTCGTACGTGTGKPDDEDTTLDDTTNDDMIH